MSDNQGPKLQSLTYGLRTNQNQLKPTPKWVWVVIAAVIIVLGVLIIMLVRSSRQVEELRQDINSQQNSSKIQEDNKALIDKVGTLLILPDDELPTIATVNDLDKLKGQPFFARAELGDKVLIYAKAKKAVLYRPSSNKIIELAPLSNNGAISNNTP